MRPILLTVIAICSALPSMVACSSENMTPPPTRARYGTPDAAPLSCVPNLDAKIEHTELQPAIGTPVQYLISPFGKDRPVDLVGKLEGGRRVWSFGTDFQDDQVLEIVASTPTGKWYAPSFPTGEFVTPSDAGLESVYRHDEQGIWLLGLASAKESPPEGKTLLVYEQGVIVLKFPLEPGAKWVTTGTITNATIRGLPYAGKDLYEIEDDGVGKLVLRDFTFEQVHRLRTKVTLSPAAGATATRRQVQFFGECFGEVTRATSKDGEPNADFTVAAELRRLGQ